MASSCRVEDERLLALVFAWVAAGGCGPAAIGDDVDASAPPDAASGLCREPPGAVVGQHLRVLYLVPSDRQADEDRIADLDSAVRQVQYWFAANTTDGISFLTRAPTVEVLNLPNPAAYYATHDAGGVERLWFYQNVRTDAFELSGASFNDPINRWVFAVEATSACEQTGDISTGGIVLLSAPNLDVLSGAPRTDPCGGQPEAQPRCPQVGLLAKHLGTAFGLRRPPGCADDDPSTDCDERALMENGAETYPNATLTEEDQDRLSSSTFFRSLNPCPRACDLTISGR
jgi:hypothetical protein